MDTMKMGLMQPYFMPYIGYWQRINAVDEHVIYDDVNYIKNGWMNHNRILQQGKVKYFTIPLQGASPNKLIYEVKVDTNPKGQGKMMKNLEYGYKKASHYNEAMAVLEPIITSKDDNLATYLEYQIRIMADYMGIDTKLVMSSSIEKNNDLKGQEKVIEICKKEGADVYINASTGEALYNREDFKRGGIELVFIKDAATVTYNQLVEEFIPSLSIIDILMNCEKDEITRLLNDYITY